MHSIWLHDGVYFGTFGNGSIAAIFIDKLFKKREISVYEQSRLTDDAMRDKELRSKLIELQESYKEHIEERILETVQSYCDYYHSFDE